jgi:hypothetical protein
MHRIEYILMLQAYLHTYFPAQRIQRSGQIGEIILVAAQIHHHNHVKQTLHDGLA